MYESYKVKRMRVMGIIPPPTCMRRWARAASDRYFRSVCAYVGGPGKNGGVAFEDLPDDRRKRGDAEIVLRLEKLAVLTEHMAKMTAPLLEPVQSSL